MRAWCATLVSIAADSAMSSAGAFSQSSVTGPSSDRSDVREVRLVPRPALAVRGPCGPRTARGKGAPGSGVELGQFGLDHRLVFLLVLAGVARPPPAAQNRDAEQEDDYPGEADPVPGLPLAGSFRRGVLHVDAVRLHVREHPR